MEAVISTKIVVQPTKVFLVWTQVETNKITSPQASENTSHLLVDINTEGSVEVLVVELEVESTQILTTWTIKKTVKEHRVALAVQAVECRVTKLKELGPEDLISNCRKYPTKWPWVEWKVFQECHQVKDSSHEEGWNLTQESKEANLHHIGQTLEQDITNQERQVDLLKTDSTPSMYQSMDQEVE